MGLPWIPACAARRSCNPLRIHSHQFPLFKNPLASRSPGWISPAVLGSLWMHSLYWSETEMDERSSEQAQLTVLVLSLRESRCTWLLQRAFSAFVCLSGLTVRGG